VFIKTEMAHADEMVCLVMEHPKQAGEEKTQMLFAAHGVIWKKKIRNPPPPLKKHKCYLRHVKNTAAICGTWGHLEKKALTQK